MKRKKRHHGISYGYSTKTTKTAVNDNILLGAF